MRIHLAAAIIGLVLAIVLILTFGRTADASSLEVCCGTMGDCPDGYKCCVGDVYCAEEREGWCRRSCGPVVN